MSLLDHFATYTCGACGKVFKATESHHLVGIDVWCSSCYRTPPAFDLPGLESGIRKAIDAVRPWLRLVPGAHRPVLEEALDKSAEWRPGHSVSFVFEPHQRKAIEAAESLAALGCVPAAYVAQAAESIASAAVLGAFASNNLDGGTASSAVAHAREGYTHLTLVPGFLAVARVIDSGSTVSVSAADLEGCCRRYGLEPRLALEFAHQLADDLQVPRPRKLRKADARLMAPLLAWISKGREPQERVSGSVA